MGIDHSTPYIHSTTILCDTMSLYAIPCLFPIPCHYVRMPYSYILYHVITMYVCHTYTMSLCTYAIPLYPIPCHYIYTMSWYTYAISVARVKGHELVYGNIPMFGTATWCPASSWPTIDDDSSSNSRSSSKLFFTPTYRPYLLPWPTQLPRRCSALVLAPTLSWQLVAQHHLPPLLLPPLSPRQGTVVSRFLWGTIYCFSRYILYLHKCTYACI